MPLTRLKNPDDRNHLMVVEEDSLTTQEMSDMEDGKPVLFDEGRHKRHLKCKANAKK